VINVLFSKFVSIGGSLVTFSFCFVLGKGSRKIIDIVVTFHLTFHPVQANAMLSRYDE
jgi:hypothetical protein